MKSALDHDILPGQFYEDCFYHPCLCLSFDREEDEIVGISLIDGSYPRSCSVRDCGVNFLSYEEAVHWKFHGPPHVDPKLIPWLEQNGKIDDYRLPMKSEVPTE